MREGAAFVMGARGKGAHHHMWHRGRRLNSERESLHVYMRRRAEPEDRRGIAATSVAATRVSRHLAPIGPAANGRAHLRRLLQQRGGGHVNRRVEGARRERRRRWEDGREEVEVD